jgi:hypothetical protein
MDEGSRPIAPVRQPRRLRPVWFAIAVVNALAACWVSYHLNWIHQRQNAKVGFAFTRVALVQPDGTTKIETIQVDPPWPLGWFGEPGRHILMLPDFSPQHEIERIRSLFPEGKVDLISLSEDEARACATADARMLHPN